MTGIRNLAQAFCDRALPPAGPVPEWVHLIPEGHIVGRDGREFELKDPGALVLAFQGNGADLPVDFEHQNDRPEARLKGPVPAAGWIKELKAAAGGLWGRVEWTATARERSGARNTATSARRSCSIPRLAKSCVSRERAWSTTRTSP